MSLLVDKFQREFQRRGFYSNFVESEHPRDGDGKFTDKGPGTKRLEGADKSFARKLVRGNGMWGASHGHSTAISVAAAKMMGIPDPRKSDFADDPAVVKQAEMMVKALKEDKEGSQEPLFHSFREPEGAEKKVGDVVDLSLTSTDGDPNNFGYGISYDQEQAVEKGESKRYHHPAQYTFPVGVPIVPYARWAQEDAEDFGFVWSEAITAGKFKVKSISEKTEPGWRKLKVRVYELEPVDDPRKYAKDDVQKIIAYLDAKYPKRDLTHYSHGASGEEVADILSGNHGNIGKIRDHLKEQYVHSDRFFPMEVPTELLEPMHVDERGGPSRTLGPLIVDLNHNKLQQKLNGVENGKVPEVHILDGNHRHYEATKSGQPTMRALVGRQAVAAINRAMIQREAKSRYSKEFVESEHPRDHGKFTDKSSKQGPDLHSAMTTLDPKAQSGALVGIKDLRKKLNLPKADFDKLMLEQARAGKISLHRHDYVAPLSKEEVEQLVFRPNPEARGAGDHPKGDYYVGASIRK